MDTKWKRINKNITYKILVYIIFFVSVFAFSYTIITVHEKDRKEEIFIESLFTENLETSNLIENKFRRAIYELESEFYNKHLQNGLKRVDCSDEFYYFVQSYNGGYITNLKDIEAMEFEKLPMFVTIEAEKDSNLETDELLPQIKFTFNNSPNLDICYGHKNVVYSLEKSEIIKRIYIGMKPNKYTELNNKFNASVQYLFREVVVLAVSLVLSLIMFILICFSTGRTNKSDGVKIKRIDKIYIEILFILVSILISIIPFVAIRIIELLENWYILDYSLYFTILAVMPMSIISLGFLTSVIRRIKAKVFFHNSFMGSLYRLIKRCFRFIRENIKLEVVLKLVLSEAERNKIAKTKLLLILNVLYVIISALIMIIIAISMEIGIFVLIAFFIIFELIVTYLFLTYSHQIHKDIDENIDDKLQKMIKSEKTKTELITGVSHDLKTPITSIIAYIDLLKKEDIKGKVKEYVDILEKKANSLATMVKDLFEIAKTASGDIKIEKEKIEINKLIKQTLADMEDKIDEYGFVIKQNYFANDLEIVSDGKKLYRVIQNLIDNALKYSLKGSRIYVQTQKKDDRIVISIKNTASYDMDFDSDEIIKKFVRADESRTEDGSGLGLAISSTFVTALGGTFEILIDGDQFNAVISL